MLGTNAQQIFERFDPNTMNIAVYLEQFDTLCEMWNIPIERKVILFISSIGHRLYSLLWDLFAPEVVKEQSFEDIAKKLQERWGKNKSNSWTV